MLTTKQETCQPCTTFRFPGCRKRYGKDGKKKRATCQWLLWQPRCMWSVKLRNENCSLPSSLW